MTYSGELKEKRDGSKIQASSRPSTGEIKILKSHKNCNKFFLSFHFLFSVRKNLKFIVWVWLKLCLVRRSDEKKSNNKRFSEGITFSKTSFGLRIISPGVGSNFLVERLTRPLSRSWLNIMTYTAIIVFKISFKEGHIFSANNQEMLLCPRTLRVSPG